MIDYILFGGWLGLAVLAVAGMCVYLYVKEMR